jgi:hypothetical protein
MDQCYYNYIWLLLSNADHFKDKWLDLAIKTIMEINSDSFGFIDLLDDSSIDSELEDGWDPWNSSLQINGIEGEEFLVSYVKLKDLLLEKRKDLVIFGEGNFTFTVALAAARRYTHFERLKSEFCGQMTPSDAEIQAGVAASWHGLTSTRLEDQNHKDVPSFDKVIELNTLMIRKNLVYDPMLCDEMCLNVVSVPPPIKPWLYGVDATTIRNPSLIDKDVVWFQCPWAWPLNEIPSLLQSFMRQMNQKEGGILLIGIINDEDCIHAYGLGELGLFDGRGFSGYEFMGVDNQLIDDLLMNYGYCYEGMEGASDNGTIIDIHRVYSDSHVTLIFEKADEGSIPSSSKLFDNPDYFLKKY